MRKVETIVKETYVKACPGDIVQVRDTGKLYTTYSNWFEYNDVDRELAARYAYGDSKIDKNRLYRVRWAASHESFDDYLVLIEPCTKQAFNKMYLISDDGLEYVDTEYIF